MTPWHLILEVIVPFLGVSDSQTSTSASTVMMNVQGNVSLKKKSLLDFQMEDTLSYKANS